MYHMMIFALYAVFAWSVALWLLMRIINQRLFIAQSVRTKVVLISDVAPLAFFKPAILVLYMLYLAIMISVPAPVPVKAIGIRNRCRRLDIRAT